MKNVLIVTFAALLTFTSLSAQSIPADLNEESIVMGHLHENGTTWFVFSEADYGKQPSNVVVTGSFRGWSHEMNDENWILDKTENGLWVLSIEDPELKSVPPGSEFKFRIDDGEWLDPPSGARNNQGGNLVFLPDVEPPRMWAELRNSGSIWIKLSGVERSLHPKDYRLTDHDGNVLEIDRILPNTAAELFIFPKSDIDIRRVYFLEFLPAELKSWCSYDGWFRETYSSKPLGAEIAEDKSSTAFRLFAPRADSVRLFLYDGKNDDTERKSFLMSMDADGVWEYIATADLHGSWYDYAVYGAEERGNHFYQQTGVKIRDPYARVSDDTWGKARVWYATEPARPLKDGIPPLEDVIAYEVHVQDFTDRLPVDESLKGTFPAMVQPGLKNDKGKPVGFDYLVDLGINVVHLMPVQEFLHYKTDEWQEAFADDPFMQKHDIARENYQWGYRTTFAFAVESRFRKKGSEPGSEREQFRDLVQAFHDRDIAVIIDIVPNHTGENMDGVNYYFNFNGIDKTYYYRTRDLEHIGEYGNEVKTENRPMTQRWLIDQCLHWINEFGIDGFRVDLAGQIDEQTLIALREAMGPDIIIYGEPWIASSDPEYESNPDWDWYKADSPITFFQDDTRNAYKGPVFDLSYGPESRGWAGGNFALRDRVMTGIQNYFPEEKTPLSGISYLDIHDNWALADQFADNPELDGRKGIMESAYKIAAVLLYTTQGPLVTHGGVELVRSKALGELKETIKETGNGLKVYIHGKRDTYNMRAPNAFLWENVGKNEGSIDYANMLNFWKGLNAFRLSEYGQIFRNAERIPEQYYRFLAPDDNNAVLGYFVDEACMVLINAGTEPFEFTDVTFPDGRWRLIADIEGVDHSNGIRRGDRGLRNPKSGRSYNVELEGGDFRIWIKR